MTTILIVIYITFISLGLPDSLFSVTWPVMHTDLEVELALGSIYSVIIAVTTGASSFFAGWLINKFGTGKITAFSVLLTAIGMLGTAFSPNFYLIMLFSIIGGLGAGAIDTGLNNYVSLNYKAIHMNWLHCFWGVGVCVSPIISAAFLGEGNWRSAYSTISYIQFGIAIIVFCSLFLWNKYDKPHLIDNKTTDKRDNFSIVEIFKTKGVISAILMLGFYCCMEFTLGTWGSTFVIKTRELLPETAALYVALYYGGIMLGRFISGIISLKVKNEMIILVGIITSLVGIALLFIPNSTITLISLFLIGVGFAPIFPSALHSVPKWFGAEKSSHITGFMMAGGYFIGFVGQVGYGLLASYTTFSITPLLLTALSLSLFIAFYITIKLTKGTAQIQ